MILYHVISNYQLLCAIVHKLSIYPTKDSTILISQWICEKCRNWEKLDRFFNNVIPINAMIAIGEKKFFSEKNVHYIEALLKKFDIDCSECEEIHIAGAHYCFGAFLTENHIPYIYWEDAAGLLSRPSIMAKNEIAQPYKQKYCIEHGLYSGHNDAVLKRICNINAQIEGFHDDLVEHFDVTAELEKLPADKRKEILAIFATTQSIDIPKNSVIFLTQHFANLQIMSFENQALIYQLVIDYFFKEKNIVFKPHPDDLMYYSLLFPDCQIIHESFPSEFLPFIFTNKPSTIATISSTGVFNLRKKFECFFSMDFKFQEHFYVIHRYYTCVWLAKKFGLSFSDIILIGTDEKLTENLFSSIEVAKMEDIGTFYIIDDISSVEGITRSYIVKLAAELPENGAIIFLNTKEDFCFHEAAQKGIWNYIVPLCISKKCVSKTEFFSDTESETLYFFSKSKRLSDMVEQFEFSKELNYTGLKVSLDKLTPQEKQIKVLEGVLAATEKRLLYYMQLAERFSKED